MLFHSLYQADQLGFGERANKKLDLFCRPIPLLALCQKVKFALVCACHAHRIPNHKWLSCRRASQAPPCRLYSDSSCFESISASVRLSLHSQIMGHSCRFSTSGEFSLKGDHHSLRFSSHFRFCLLLEPSSRVDRKLMNIAFEFQWVPQIVANHHQTDRNLRSSPLGSL